MLQAYLLKIPMQYACIFYVPSSIHRNSNKVGQLSIICKMKIRWRAKIKLTSVTHHLFLNVFEAQPSVSFHSSSSHRSTISILKITFFRNEIDWIGLFILFPLKTEHVKFTRSNKPLVVPTKTFAVQIKFNWWSNMYYK